MIIDFDNTYLEFVRGDTVSIPLRLNFGTREYPEIRELTDNEQLVVALMRPNQPYEEAIIKKTLDKDSEHPSIFSLSHDDTVNLDIGKYYFTVKYINNNEVETVVNSKLLFVTGSPKPEAGIWQH